MIRGALSGLLVGALRRRGAAFGPGSGVGGGPSTSLDLNFIAMAASQTLDPRITFSRGTLATLTNAAGNVAYAPHNLCTRSEALNAAGWTSTGQSVTLAAGTAPDGSNTANLLTASAGTASKQTWNTVGSPTTATTNTVYAKAGTASWLAVAFDVQGATDGAYFNLATGVVGTVTGGASARITALSNGWYRCEVTRTYASANHAITFEIHSADNQGTSWTAAGTETIYLWGAQLNAGAPATVYCPTTSAAYFGPRFTYDPITHAALGLLIEEQRTNLLLWSEALNNAVWVKSGCTITADATVAPDGNSTADLVVVTGAPGSGNVQSSAPSSTSGTVTFSVYAKAGSRSIFNLTPFNGSPNTDFNLSTVSKTDNGGAVGSITSVGNGWYRCSCTITLGAPSTQRSFIWSADGIYIWGAQLEAGGSATSYIPTTSASVTRAADSATMTGANFSSWFNASAGSFVVEVAQTTKITTLSKNWMSANDASLANRIQVSSNNIADVNFALVSASASQANITGANLAAGAHKIAVRYAANDFALVADGLVSGTDTAGVVPVGVTQINIGTRDGGQDPINNCISRLRYYNTALTNAQLQTLTT